MKLSVLDLIPVRGDQTTAQALHASKSLVGAADTLGYTRYWVAEHHNMKSVASTSPGIELMHLGQGTERIRLGSGGVMLPNHAPLAVAEQFALLSAVYGDRIDLGIGRAPGTDPITSMAMRGHLGEGRMVDREGNQIDPVEQFPQHVMDTLALLSPEGAAVPMFGGREHRLAASPRMTAAPQVWLLGSSGYSAQLSAALGLPYVFAHHFSGHGTEAALNLYRNSFTPTAHAGQPEVSAPTTFLTVNAVVADTREEALALAEPYMFTMANLRIGAPITTLPLVGADVAEKMSAGHRELAEKMLSTWIVGTPAEAAAQLQETTARFDVDEVMIHPVAGARPEDPLDEVPGRTRTLELLAGELLG